MNKFLISIIILVLFISTASAARISGNVVSDGKTLSGQTVTLSRINGTNQSAESITGVVYDFAPLADTVTAKNGSYVFKDIENGEYRVNLTYRGITFGKNILLEDKAVVDFNLSGTVEGYVLKKNKPREGVPLSLADSYGIEVMNASTDSNGKYSFDNINAGDTYFVTAVYADVPYTKLVNESERTNFTVYETTDEMDDIGVTLDHIFLSRTPAGIGINEYVEFINTGDKVFFSPNRTWLAIPTPRDISSFQTDIMECCLVREEDAAWIDPMQPIMPGETYSAQISYIFNPLSEPVSFKKGIMYNTSYMSLFSEKNNGFGIESRFARKEIVSEGGKEFDVLTFKNISRGQFQDVRITGFVPSKNETKNNAGFLVPLLLVLLAGALSYPFIKKKIMLKKRKVFIKESYSPSNPPDENGGITASAIHTGSEDASSKTIDEMSFRELLAERNGLFESIMILDNEFNKGNVEEQEYGEQKKELRDSAVQVINRLKDTATNLDLTQPVPALARVINLVDDIEVLEKLLEREEKGDNRNELEDIIEDRIEDIESNE